MSLQSGAHRILPRCRSSTATGRRSIAATPNEITREGGSRRLDVTLNVRGRDLGAVAADIRQALGAVTFAPEYHAELLGEYAAREESRRTLLTLSGFALIGIFLLLYVDFGSARLAGLVFVTLPFALVGGVLAALLTSGVLSLGSLVGFVTVLGACRAGRQQGGARNRAPDGGSHPRWALYVDRIESSSVTCPIPALGPGWGQILNHYFFHGLTPDWVPEREKTDNSRSDPLEAVRTSR